MKKLYYKFTKKYWSMLSYEHARKHNFVVQYGIFKNLKMNDKVSWGKGDIGSKIYGIYENKIQQKLKDISKPILIDIGAADGFFAIGCLKSKICEFCYAFEEIKISNKSIETLARSKKIDFDRQIRKQKAKIKQAVKKFDEGSIDEDEYIKQVGKIMENINKIQMTFFGRLAGVDPYGFRWFDKLSDGEEK